MPARLREAACDALQIGEDPVAPLRLQAVEGGGEESLVIHDLAQTGGRELT
jgi:hypothetical protein